MSNVHKQIALFARIIRYCLYLGIYIYVNDQPNKVVITISIAAACRGTFVNLCMLKDQWKCCNREGKPLHSEDREQIVTHVRRLFDQVQKERAELFNRC